MEKDKKHPIYTASVKWTYDDGSSDSAGWKEYLPNGSCPETRAKEISDKWLPEYLKQKEKPPAKTCSITYTYSHSETWCLNWFSHCSKNVDLTDQEALESFEQYVRRIEEHNQNYYGVSIIDDELPCILEPHCLMGAEDRYRWCGHPGNEKHDRTPAPCRCEGCRELGVIRICH